MASWSRLFHSSFFTVLPVINKFFERHLVVKSNDKNERRFDRSTVIFKFEFGNKIQHYIDNCETILIKIIKRFFSKEK